MSNDKNPSRHGSVPPDVLRAFGVSGQVTRLSGGQGEAVRVGEWVFKPVENPGRHEWSCALVEAIDHPAFRVSRPKKSSNGRFAFQGWGATKFEPGRDVRGDWKTKLRVCAHFHEAVSRLSVSPMPPSTDYWSLANEIAWGAAQLPAGLDPEIHSSLLSLLRRRGTLPRPTAIMHGDMCGNTLIHDTLTPLVIDFSPGVGDVYFASSILVADAVAWEGAPADLVDDLDVPSNSRAQFLLRAVLFRLVVSALFRPQDLSNFRAEWQNFSPVLDRLE